MDDYGGLAEDILSMREDRRMSIRALLADCKREDQERTAEVKEMVTGFAQENAEIKADTQRLVADIGAENREQIEGFKVENQERARAWQEVLVTLQGRAVVAEAKAPAPEAAAPEAAPPEAAPPKAARPTAEKMLEVIDKYPEGGIRLVDIGNELGVDWRTLIGSVKSLVDGGQVEKIENVYYPKKEE